MVRTGCARVTIILIAIVLLDAGGLRAQMVLERHEVDGYVIEQVLASGRPPRMRVSRGASVLEISADELPVLEEDCAGYCKSLPLVSMCYGLCIRGAPTYLAFDGRAKRVYLAAMTDSQGDVPHVFFAVDIEGPRTHGRAPVRRLGMVMASALLDPHVSPEGGYLSVLTASRIGGRDGAWDLDVIDVATGEQVRASRGDGPMLRASEDTVTNVLHYRWIDDRRVVMLIERRPRHSPGPSADRLPYVERIFDIPNRRIVSEKLAAR